MRHAFFLGLVFACLVPNTAEAQLIERLCESKAPFNFEQFRAGEIRWYKQADANRDGIIDAEEQAAVWQSHAQDILPSCKNFQNVTVLKLTRAPTEAEARKDFARIDLNKDGLIDAEEDRQATLTLNQSCVFLQNPHVQKMQKLLEQLRQPR